MVLLSGGMELSVCGVQEVRKGSADDVDLAWIWIYMLHLQHTRRLSRHHA